MDPETLDNTVKKLATGLVKNWKNEVGKKTPKQREDA
jgi:hypothetical protein